MRHFLATLICVALVGELVQAVSSSSFEWTLFKSKHGKSYESQAEDNRRYANFLATKQRVERHNAQSNSSFEMGLNHLADWDRQELAKLTVDGSAFVEPLENMSENEAYLAEILARSSEPVPDEFDWRKVPGRVGPIRAQGTCSAGWAFSTVGALEGQEMGRVFNDSKHVVQLSVQELIDCSLSCRGCGGGVSSLALDDLKQLGGVMSDKDYLYRADESTCAFNKDKVVLKVAGYVPLPSKDEDKLKQVLARFGPISTALEVRNSLLAYRSGVFVDDNCYTKRPVLSHGVLLVGYGTDPIDGDYWIVKNSWGPYWGEYGYARIKRGVDMCGIAYAPTIPKFDDGNMM